MNYSDYPPVGAPSGHNRHKPPPLGDDIEHPPSPSSLGRLADNLPIKNTFIQFPTINPSPGLAPRHAPNTTYYSRIKCLCHVKCVNSIVLCIEFYYFNNCNFVRPAMTASHIESSLRMAASSPTGAHANARLHTLKRPPSPPVDVAHEASYGLRGVSAPEGYPLPSPSTDPYLQQYPGGNFWRFVRVQLIDCNFNLMLLCGQCHFILHHFAFGHFWQVMAACRRPFLKNHQVTDGST